MLSKAVAPKRGISTILGSRRDVFLVKFQPSCAGFPEENQFLSVFHLNQKRKKGSFWNLTQKLSNNGSRNSSLTHSPEKGLSWKRFRFWAISQKQWRFRKSVYKKVIRNMPPGKHLSCKKEFIGQKCLLFTIWIRAGFQVILEGTGGREQETELSMVCICCSSSCTDSKGPLIVRWIVEQELLLCFWTSVFSLALLTSGSPFRDENSEVDVELPETITGTFAN